MRCHRNAQPSYTTPRYSEVLFNSQGDDGTVARQTTASGAPRQGHSESAVHVRNNFLWGFRTPLRPRNPLTSKRPVEGAAHNGGGSSSWRATSSIRDWYHFFVSSPTTTMYALEGPLDISDDTRHNARMRQRRRMIRLSRAQGHRRGPTRPCTHTAYTLLFVVSDVNILKNSRVLSTGLRPKVACAYLKSSL